MPRGILRQLTESASRSENAARHTSVDFAAGALPGRASGPPTCHTSEHNPDGTLDGFTRLEVCENERRHGAPSHGAPHVVPRLP